MSQETPLTITLSKISTPPEKLDIFLDVVKKSVVRVLDWLSPNLQPIPPDTYSSEEKFFGRTLFTQADHDRLWNQVKDYNFSKN